MAQAISNEPRRLTQIRGNATVRVKHSLISEATREREGLREERSFTEESYLSTSDRRLGNQQHTARSGTTAQRCSQLAQRPTRRCSASHRGLSSSRRRQSRSANLPRLWGNDKANQQRCPFHWPRYLKALRKNRRSEREKRTSPLISQAHRCTTPHLIQNTASDHLTSSFKGGGKLLVNYRYLKYFTTHFYNKFLTNLSNSNLSFIILVTHIFVC